jgi:hypothetical protein
MTPNGPAVEGITVGGAVHRYESRYFSQKAVMVQACPPAGREGAARFLPVQVQSWLSITSVAVQSWLLAIYLSPVTNIMRCSGAVRVYHYLQCCHGCRSTCLPAGRKAKTMPNLLILLSVLGGRSILKLSPVNQIGLIDFSF